MRSSRCQCDPLAPGCRGAGVPGCRGAFSGRWRLGEGAEVAVRPVAHAVSPGGPQTRSGSGFLSARRSVGKDSWRGGQSALCLSVLGSPVRVWCSCWPASTSGASCSTVVLGRLRLGLRAVSVLAAAPRPRLVARGSSAQHDVGALRVRPQAGVAPARIEPEASACGTGVLSGRRRGAVGRWRWGRWPLSRRRASHRLRIADWSRTADGRPPPTAAPCRSLRRFALLADPSGVPHRGVEPRLPTRRGHDASVSVDPPRRPTTAAAVLTGSAGGRHLRGWTPHPNLPPVVLRGWWATGHRLDAPTFRERASTARLV
jgi:hypothetical protein